MEEKRSCRLVLKTSDLTTNASTNIGTCDQFRTSFTWNNINLRMLLGDMYDQYDYFNITLISISSSLTQALAAGATADDKIVFVKMSGLPFINQTFQQSTGNNGTFAYVSTLSIPLTANTSTQFYNNLGNVCTFNKDQDQCNINISFFRVLDDTRPALNAGNINPQFSFIFVITGINKPDNPDRINHLMRIK
jgi:hypothetical protein